MSDGDRAPGKRRSRRRRIAQVAAAATALLLPVATLLSGSAEYLSVALIPSLLFIAMVFFGGPASPPGPTGGEDGGDGGDGGSRRPDPPLGMPPGGLPLPLSRPAGRRYQGTTRTTLIPARERRSACEPIRRGVPTQTRRQAVRDH